MENDILKLSYENDLSHIPSALSMLNYLDRLYYNKILSKHNHTVIGKPHGAQSYFYIWKKYGLIDNYNNISTSLKNNDVNFLDFSIDILGDALGIGSGISHVSDKLVWVNIGDGVLQMGNTLEAIQYIFPSGANTPPTYLLVPVIPVIVVVSIVFVSGSIIKTFSAV